MIQSRSRRSSSFAASVNQRKDTTGDGGASTLVPIICSLRVDYTMFKLEALENKVGKMLTWIPSAATTRSKCRTSPVLNSIVPFDGSHPRTLVPKYNLAA